MRNADATCAWCGDPTILATAIGPRAKLGVCPACFKNYRPCTEAQRTRVVAVVRAAYIKKIGKAVTMDDPSVQAVAQILVESGDFDMGDRWLRDRATQEVASWVADVAKEGGKA